MATAAILGAVPPYLIENVRPLAVPYQGNKVDRPQASFEAHLATLRPCHFATLLPTVRNL